MRSVADGDLAVTKEFAGEMYYCLGCLACETACPAGVNYAELFETARAEVERSGVLDAPERGFWRWLTLNVLFMHPRLLRLVGAGLRFWQQTGLDRFMRRVSFLGFLPKHLRDLEPQTPRMAAVFSDSLIAPFESPKEKSLYRVGLLTGCIQDLAFSQVNRDTVDVLLANGCDVITPRTQSCCGSLHAHNGAVELARELARRQIDSFDLDSLDAIITNAGGCGAHLKQYGHLLQNDPFYAAKARRWDQKVKDIHEWMSEIGIRKPAKDAGVTEVTYHESCHLCHGQKVSSQPRQMLQAIPGLVLKEMAESNWCCGSAGIYNITQPEQSAKLLQRKVANIERTRVGVVVTSNPGCHLQLVNGLHGKVTVSQPVTLLAKAYRAEALNESSTGISPSLHSVEF
jgi:glycolate oxidase iron-sulfur subunit